MEFIYLLIIILICIIIKLFQKYYEPQKINLYQIYHNKKLIPKKIYDNIKKYAKNYNHIIFDYQECQYFIGKYYGNEGIFTWNNLQNMSHKADFWRYCILYKYGGLYLDIKVELIKPIDKIIVNKNIIYTGTCAINKNNCITIGILYSPPKNPLIFKCLRYCISTATSYSINTSLRYLINNSNYFYYYHINTSYFSQIIKENSENKSILKNGLIKMKNKIPNVYLFQEICTTKKKDCYDGLDIKGLCCYIYDKGEKIIKVRYSDYPW